jgi:hypothetical protein
VSADAYLEHVLLQQQQHAVASEQTAWAFGSLFAPKITPAEITSIANKTNKLFRRFRISSPPVSTGSADSPPLYQR